MTNLLLELKFALYQYLIDLTIYLKESYPHRHYKNTFSTQFFSSERFSLTNVPIFIVTIIFFRGLPLGPTLLYVINIFHCYLNPGAKINLVAIQHPKLIQ